MRSIHVGIVVAGLLTANCLSGSAYALGEEMFGNKPLNDAFHVVAGFRVPPRLGSGLS